MGRAKKKKKIVKQISVFSGCVVKDNKILLVKRWEEECKGAHLKWEIPGGKAKMGENPEDAVVREIFEETGVKVIVEEMLPIIQSHLWDYEWGIQQVFCFYFVCKFIREVKKRGRDHHVEDIKWVSLKKAKKLDSLPKTNEVLELLI